MITFNEWATEEKFNSFVHKFKRGDQDKYKFILNTSLEKILSITDLGIPKKVVLTDKNGKERVVYSLGRKESLYCSFYTEYLDQVYGNLINSSVVSYQKGVSVGKVCKDLSRCMETKTFIKLDIKKYFDSVSKSTLIKAMEELGFPDNLRVVYLQDKFIFEDQEHDQYLGITQGNPISSFLAKYILRDFDNWMNSLCEIYYRYSDDILFSYEGSPTEMINLVESYLSKFGLSVNKAKTELYSGTVEFLGLLVSPGKVTATKKYMEQFRSTIKLTGKEKKERNVGKYLYRVVNVLTSQWVRTSFYGSRLEYLYGALTDSGQFYELDNLIYANIQFLLTGSRNSNVACKKGLTFKAIKDEYGFSLEDAFYFYKESEIMARAYFGSFMVRDLPKENKFYSLEEVLSWEDLQYDTYTERVYSSKAKEGYVSYDCIFDDTGDVLDSEVLNRALEGLTYQTSSKRIPSLFVDKVSKFNLYERYDIGRDFKLFLLHICFNSLDHNTKGFKVIRNMQGEIKAVKYKKTWRTSNERI